LKVYDNNEKIHHHVVTYWPEFVMLFDELFMFGEINRKQLKTARTGQGLMLFFIELECSTH
jgi:hypothetical protein